jgi:glycine cleavage system regulatory protein
MQSSLVITIIGPDRPGLVETLSKAVTEHGGNWTQSRMAHLAGQFAGILHVILPTDCAPAFRETLDRLCDSGDLQITVAEETGGTAERKGAIALNLELVGQDRTGIVKEISHALASHGINVEELSTECESAPWSGEMLFKAHASLAAPEGIDVDELQRDLEAIAHDLMVEVNLVRPL